MRPKGPELRGVATQGERPDWGPLLRAVGEEVAGDFMWMYEVETAEGSIHAYKHIDTRRYVHLDADLNAYAWVGSESYRRVPIWLVLEEALRDAERLKLAYDLEELGPDDSW